MKVVVQLVLHSEDGDPVEIAEVFTFQREALAPASLGLALGEAKDLLAAVQAALVDAQVKACLDAAVPCPLCGRARAHKDTRQIVVRSLFGTLRLPSPRWWHCPCSAAATRSFGPLTQAIPDRTTPELAYLQARFAGLVSYGLTAELLSEVLPLGRVLYPGVVRAGVHAVAQRLEDELGEERFSFIDTCQREVEALPRPDLPRVVGLDGGYVHSAAATSRKDGWFEVIVGKAVPAQGRASCFGYVQTYDTKPKRRLFELLKSHGMTDNQAVSFLTDGGEDIRDLPHRLNPQAEHLLDWFHITMRITVMTNMANGLTAAPSTPGRPGDAGDDDQEQDLRRYRESVAAALPGELQRLKWFLWHGNLFRALQTVEDITADLQALRPDGEPSKLFTAMCEFDGYIRANAGRIPNYGERRRAGEAISTAFVESTVNQVISKRMLKKQQMRWTPRGAHLLLQIRTRVLNDTLVGDFHRWHPGFTHRDDLQDLAA